MATIYGNVGKTVVEGSGTEFGKTKLILKEEAKKFWSVYRATDNTLFRPYPVFDQAGTPCPSRLDNVDSDVNPYALLSEAFVVLRVAAFAGVNKSLEFIDYCTDSLQYAPPGVEYIRTPYEFLVNAIRKMMPDQGATLPKDGKPMPKQLAVIQKSVGHANEAILCRAAVLENRGAPMQTKASDNGILFNTVFYIPQRTAITQILKLFESRIQVNVPASSTNNPLASIFNLDGAAIRVQKVVNSGGRGTAYSAMADYSKTYAQIAANHFKARDEMAYFNGLRDMFGAFPRVEDLLHNFTVAEMVAMLKENYPISWLWYAWKDTPYAGCVTQEERNQAMQDPEMAERFGLPPVAVTVNAQPAAAERTYPTNTGAHNQRPYTPTYNQYTPPSAMSYTATGVPEPAFQAAPTGVPGVDVHNVQTEGAVATPTKSDEDALLEKYMAKYGQSKPTEDGIKY